MYLTSATLTVYDWCLLAAMAELAETARTTESMLLKIKAGHSRLDADSTSKLRGNELKAANHALQPVFALGESLVEQVRRDRVQLDEAMLFLRDAKLCELLLSLLRRWPWAEMRQHALMQQGLALLPRVLAALFSFLSAATHVHGSKQESAYKEMSKRCLSQAQWPALD